jgi:hypothetical protein
MNPFVGGIVRENISSQKGDEEPPNGYLINPS